MTGDPRWEGDLSTTRPRCPSCGTQLTLLRKIGTYSGSEVDAVVCYSCGFIKAKKFIPDTIGCNTPGRSVIRENDMRKLRKSVYKPRQLKIYR